MLICVYGCMTLDQIQAERCVLMFVSRTVRMFPALDYLHLCQMHWQKTIIGFLVSNRLAFTQNISVSACRSEMHLRVAREGSQSWGKCVNGDDGGAA
jgi:hypothetical protein